MPNFDKLPNFFIIGAAKAGTTTLYELLRQHPQVYVPARKEPVFFSEEDNFSKGVAWYEETFFERAERYPVRGEASPQYLYWSEKVAPRLKVLYGERTVRFIVCFRDPVGRAYSWFWNMAKEGIEDLPFAAAIAHEEQRLEEAGQAADERGAMAYGYFAGGRYASLMRPLLDLFPREDFLLLFQEDFETDPEGVARAVFGFLGVEQPASARLTRSNPAGVLRSRFVHDLLLERSIIKEAIKPLLPRSVRWRLLTSLMNLNLKSTAHPPIDEDLELKLRRRYRDEVLGLQEITGRDLSHWLAEE